MTLEKLDVIVIGAGFSGILAVYKWEYNSWEAREAGEKRYEDWLVTAGCVGWDFEYAESNARSGSEAFGVRTPTPRLQPTAPSLSTNFTSRTYSRAGDGESNSQVARRCSGISSMSMPNGTSLPALSSVYPCLGLNTRKRLRDGPCRWKMADERMRSGSSQL